MRREGEINKLQQQAKEQKKRRHARLIWDENTKTKQQTSLIIQMENVNQRILVKEEGLKRYRDRVKRSKQNDLK